METALQLEAPALDLLELLHEIERIHHHAVADHAVLAVVENPGRHEMEDILLIPEDHGVTSVRAALETDHDIRLFSQEVNDLALAFIAPLGPNEYSIHNVDVLYQI